jgi:hypothetical protein
VDVHVGVSAPTNPLHLRAMVIRACARMALHRVPRRALSSVGADHADETSPFKGVAFGLNTL